MRVVLIWNLVAYSILVLGVPAVLFWYFRRCERSRVSERPSCAKCLYPVEHLPTSICPECGSDLKVVGIITYRRRWWAVAGQVVALTALFVFGFIALANLVGPQLPERVHRAHFSFIGPTDQFATHCFYVVREDATWQRAAQQIQGIAPARPGRVSVAFDPACAQTITGTRSGAVIPGTHRLSVDEINEVITTIDPQGERANQKAFDRSDLVAWLQSLPLNLDEQQANEHANTLLLFAESAGDGSEVGAEVMEEWSRQATARNITMPLLYRGGGSFGSNQSDDLYLTGGVILAAALWLWLTYRIVRGKRAPA